MNKKEDTESKKEDKKDAPAADKAPVDEAPAKAKEDEAADAPAPDAPEQKDKKDDSDDGDLFKKLISQCLGDDHSDNSEAMECAKEAFKGFHEGLGYSKEDAMSASGHVLKLAKHMGDQKSKAKEDEAADDKADKLPGEPKDDKKDAAPAKEDESKKEAEEALKKMEAAVTQLTADNVKLKESLKKHEVETHLEKVCRESGLSFDATKAFRKMHEGIKSVEEIDTKMASYKEAFKKSGSGFSTFTVGAEKSFGVVSEGTGFAGFIKK